ncbi:50S ribosomal protein L2 [Candidatus Woesearchaeota archaeon]|nr:50S ribosomal protein L2 [Candidatus Woesearchaeota archaeon]
MGKRIIAQRRGSGSTAYRAPSFRFKGDARHKSYSKEIQKGMVLDLISCQAHTAPLAVIEFEDGERTLMIAHEGVAVGEMVEVNDAEAKVGNTVPLIRIPEGTSVFNIEGIPGDGGKFVRASGTFAKILSQQGTSVVIQLPSKKKKVFDGNCRATIGVVSGSGRPEKPLLKAGNSYYKMKARNHLWPKVSGSAMNAVDHPFGNKRTLRKSKAKPTSRHAPPGRKVGLIAARRTGRKKR